MERIYGVRNRLVRLSWVFGMMITLSSGCPASKSTTMTSFAPLIEYCKGVATPCKVRLSEITKFEWDRVAFIRMQASPTQAAAALGLKALPKKEFEDLIVFMKGDQIASMDKRPYDPERPFHRTVFLDFDETRDKWKIFTQNQDLFQVIIDSSDGHDNILLRPIGTSPPARE